jgi:cyanophycinase
MIPVKASTVLPEDLYRGTLTMQNNNENNQRPIKSECPVPAGVLLIIGGKENKEGDKAPDRKTPRGFVSKDILQIFCEHTGKKRAGICVITTGSAEGKASFEDYKKVFTELGHDALTHIHHTTRQEVLDDQHVIDTIKQADGFFFAGGDQLLLTSLYGGTELLTDLKERYISDRIIIGGTSAGAMAMSTPMIYAGNEEVQQISGEIKVTTGLEFLRDVCIDTHFVHRSRFVRLAQVIATNPGCTGIGIEEDTAVLLSNGTEAEVAGSGTVIIIEGFSIVDANMKNFSEKKPFSVRNLKVDILAAGDKFVIEQKNPAHK